MTLYNNATGSVASNVAQIHSVGQAVLRWRGLTGGSFTPQWSKDNSTWTNYTSGSQNGASGELMLDPEGGVYFRLNGDSMTGGVYAYLDGKYVQAL